MKILPYYNIFSHKGVALLYVLLLLFSIIACDGSIVPPVGEEPGKDPSAISQDAPSPPERESELQISSLENYVYGASAKYTTDDNSTLTIKADTTIIAPYEYMGKYKGKRKRSRDEESIIDNDDEYKEYEKINYSGKGKIFEELILPQTLVIIHDGGFAFNNLKDNLIIPNSVQKIGHFAFTMNNITSLHLGTSVKSIGDFAFRNNLIQSLVIPDSVTSIGTRAFANNSAGNQLVIPDSVTSIGEYAFAYNKITDLTIGVGLKSISKGAFSFNKFKTLIIGTIDNGKSITTIGEKAFYSSQKLKNLLIGPSITRIDNEAFGGAPLESLTIGASVTEKKLVIMFF